MSAMPLSAQARTTLHALLMVVVGIVAAGARAEGMDDDTLRRAQAERLRAEIANHLHLKAYDLLDELVLGWKSAPPFGVDTPVILADVTGPFGFGSGLEALLENHVTDLLLKNPDAHLRLVHCAPCAALVVHSDARGTTFAKGVDQPETLAALGIKAGSQHALFIDFEAEGSALVLRARITAIAEQAPIVHARTLSSSTSSAALLRAGDRLVTADQARAEYLDALKQRGPVTIPVRMAVTRFASRGDGVNLALPPIVWVESGAELAINHSRNWMGSLMVGGTWVPLLYSGFLVQSRVYRLLTGPATSLTHPNVYLFGGASLTMLQGATALLLRDTQPALTDIIAVALNGASAPTFYPSFQAGLDFRIGNRVGGAFFVESMPTLFGALSVGSYAIGINSVGGEVSLCF